MNLLDAEKLAKDKMKEHGLTERGWWFEFDRAKRRFGCCHHSLKKITMSSALTELNSEEVVLDTILHEIAHALVSARHGHDAVWRRKAIEIGCNGSRTYGNETIRPPYPYKGVCPNGHETKARKRMRVACSKCCNAHNNGRFSSEYMFVWETIS